MSQNEVDLLGTQLGNLTN